MFDYNKLRGRIREICGTQDVFAKALGISKTTLSQKINNHVEFTQKEIEFSVDILKIDKSDITDYFFNVKVQNI